MDPDRKSNVSSFYGGRKSSIDALNSDFAAPIAPQSRGLRDDASSFFTPERGRNSTDLLTGQPNSAGYNRGSFFHTGREEPLKGGRDEEDGRSPGNDGVWDVYADFNNAGPRYSAATFGTQDSGYRQISPASPMIKPEETMSTHGPVEMVTVPALGPEWQREEMRDMTKAGRREKKAETRTAKWKAWNRGERGMCGKWFTRRVFVFFLFGLCGLVALVLGFTVPRVPGFAINNEPLRPATGKYANFVPSGFSRAPANFSFPAFVALQVDTQANWLPLTFNSIHASVFDLDTTRVVGHGDLGKFTLPAKSFPNIVFPLNFTYIATNDTDQTWKNWYMSCRNSALYPDGVRPAAKFRLLLEMKIAGLLSTHSTSTQVSDAECPIELPQNAA